MEEKNLKKKRERKEVKSVEFAKSQAILTRTAGSRTSSPNAPISIKSKGGGQADAGLLKPPQKCARRDSTNVVEDVEDIIEDAQYYEKDVAFVGDNMEEVIDEQNNGLQTEANYSQGKAVKLITYDWLADSGTTSHIMKIKFALTDYVPLKAHKVIDISN
ncbi:hypothetical protein C8R48DRAFT_677809 [Suillus tomentosus]|nr:hypothetical protein C8R48DRAFT_677809 [Suillus tomentosus]